MTDLAELKRLTPFDKFVSDEPTHMILLNECNAQIESICTRRFRALQNIILSLIERVEKAEAERDEASNWTATVEKYGTDQFDDLAAKWVAMDAITRVRNAVASVFSKWASEELLVRFREHMDRAMQLAFVEGALCGVRAAESSAHAAGRAEALEEAAKVAEEWAERHNSRITDDVRASVGAADAANACDDVAENIRALKEKAVAAAIRARGE